MHNWDYPKMDPAKKDEPWYLQRLLLYGLGGEKIDRNILETKWKELRLPDDTRAFLELLLWNKAF